MKTLKFKLFPDSTITYTLRLSMHRYASNNSLAVLAECFDKDFDAYVPFCDVTVNLEETSMIPAFVGEGFAFVDENDTPGIGKTLEKAGLASFTGIMGQSGFCAYPLYKFDLDKLRAFVYENTYDDEKEGVQA